jgi:hypothetical protein
MRSIPCFLAIALALYSAPASAQSSRPPRRHSSHVPPPRQFPIGGSAPSGVRLKTPADLASRIARWPTVEMPFRSRGLTPRQIKMIGKLVEAARLIDSIYWRQSDPYALTLAAQLKGSRAPRDRQILRYLSINGGQYDLLDGNRSFINGQPAPAGRGFYPDGANPGADSGLNSDATRQSIEAYAQAHPESRAELYSPYTLVRPMGADLVGLPYRSAFRAQLQEAAQELREAAALSDDAPFAGFLAARASALVSDDYQASDLLWLALNQPEIDLILAPCLPELDPLFGVKTSFGAAILIRDDVRNAEESRKLALFQPTIAQIQQSLPLDAFDKPNRPPSTLEVVDSPFRAGALLHGYQRLAVTLPSTTLSSDPQLRAARGSRKIFFKDVIDARFQHVILPLAHKLMDSSQSRLLTASGYLTTVVMQEIGRGLGPDTARVGGVHGLSIPESLGPIFPALDQAKADAAGMYAAAWLIEHNLLPTERQPELYACYLAGLLRALLPNPAQAPAQLMEFNYLIEQGAIVPRAGTLSHGTAPVVFAIDFARMPAALGALNRQLLEIEASGDRPRAAQWFARYATPPPALQSALQSGRNLGVDIFPSFSWDLPLK